MDKIGGFVPLSDKAKAEYQEQYDKLLEINPKYAEQFKNNIQRYSHESKVDVEVWKPTQQLEMEKHEALSKESENNTSIDSLYGENPNLQIDETEQENEQELD